MKRFLFVTAVAAMAFPALVAAADVSIQIGEPGFYGSIDVGGFPQPQLIYPQPVVIQEVPVVGVVYEPIYLYVPSSHATNWGKHCGEYNACGKPVYFVQDRWYSQQYVPRYRESHRGHGQGRGGNQGNGHGQGKGKPNKGD